MGEAVTPFPETWGSHMTKDWKDLPLKNGEDGQDYTNAYARYAHTGCPGWQFEDTCPHPWDCAVRGSCRIAYEKAGRRMAGE